jgi:hypothetical protein
MALSRMIRDATYNRYDLVNSPAHVFFAPCRQYVYSSSSLGLGDSQDEGTNTAILKPKFIDCMRVC